MPLQSPKLGHHDPIANDFTTTAAVCDEQLAPEVGRVPVNKDGGHLVSILVSMPNLRRVREHQEIIVNALKLLEYEYHSIFVQNITLKYLIHQVIFKKMSEVFAIDK